MLIKATFTGEPSLGYLPGNEYELLLHSEGERLLVELRDGTGRCPYSSPTSFFLNWTNIRLIKPAVRASIPPIL